MEHTYLSLQTNSSEERLQEPVAQKTCALSLAQSLQNEITADGFIATKGIVAEHVDIFHLASRGSHSIQIHQHGFW